MLQITSTNEEKVLVTLAPVTAAGNPAEVENVTFDISEGDATVEEVVANKSYYFISGGTGLSKFTVKADGDLGEGVTELNDEVEYYVVSAQASSLGFTAGEPELK